jgi:hypothetical protein
MTSNSSTRRSLRSSLIDLNGHLPGGCVDLVEFITSAPAVVAVVEGERAVADFQLPVGKQAGIVGGAG